MRSQKQKYLLELESLNFFCFVVFCLCFFFFGEFFGEVCEEGFRKSKNILFGGFGFFCCFFFFFFCFSFLFVTEKNLNGILNST